MTVVHPRPRLAAQNAAPPPRRWRRTRGIDPDDGLTFLAIRPLGNLFLRVRGLERSENLLHLAMQLPYSPVQANPLEVQYSGNDPFLKGEGQAVQYSLRPVSTGRTPIPIRRGENHLRHAVAAALAAGVRPCDRMVRVQTDPHRLPVEDVTANATAPVEPTDAATFPAALDADPDR